MRKLIRWILWLWRGKPMIEYSGYNCGCCGQWVERSFLVPQYLSFGQWWDTWGVCRDCTIANSDYE